MRRATFFFVVLVSYFPVWAQHENESVKEVETEASNFIGAFAGNTIIVQSGFNLPTIGVEYVREITPRIGVGLSAELELGSHVIQKDEAGGIVSEVEREGAFLILPSVFFRAYHGLILTVGYGVELEKNENLALLKLGAEYKLRMHNPNWLILPQVSWDHTNLFDGVVYGVTFGYVF